MKAACAALYPLNVVHPTCVSGMSRKLAYLLAAASAAVAAACAANDSAHEVTLWTPPEAVNVRTSHYEDGTANVSFEVVASYPAESLILGIAKQLGNDGWQLRERQSVSAGSEPPALTEWRVGTRGVRLSDRELGPQEARYYEWQREWEDSHGNIVMYRLSINEDRVLGYGEYHPGSVY